ncbi:MAG: hypothetical protein ACTSP3_12005 [Candidatus Heimdallarchaeaceae archaeon]
METIKERVKKSSDEKKYRDSFQIEKERLFQSLAKETGEKKEKIYLIISAILSESLFEQGLINNEKIVKKIKILFDIDVNLSILERIAEKLYSNSYIINHNVSEEGRKLLKISLL